MLKNVRIRNFRIFEDLEIGKMSRVNLFAGLNSSGKTTLLEAIFLLAGGGNPQLAVNANVVRGDSLSVKSEMAQEVLWKPMFFDLDISKNIEISGNRETLEPLTLKISLSMPNQIKLDRLKPSMGLLGDHVLEFSFRDNSNNDAHGKVHVTEQGYRIEVPGDIFMPFPTVILSSRATNHQEDAMRLGRLRKRKQHDFVAEALRLIDSRLQSVEDNTASGHPMIWADIGLPELVPLPALGEGMTKVARLVMAICLAPDGVVLVDEIENGLHHSVMPDVWRAIDRAAREFDTQVIATTHSFECFAAAHRALGDDGFLFHRLEAENGANRCVTYPAEAIEGAVEHGLEVR